MCLDARQKSCESSGATPKSIAPFASTNEASKVQDRSAGVSMVLLINTELCVVRKTASAQHPQSTIASLQKAVMVEQQRVQKT